MIDLAIDSRLFINEEIDLALQELDLLFNTDNTELIGYPFFGTNFESFLHELTPSKAALKEYIINKINEDTYYLRMYNVEVDVDYVVEQTRGTYIIHIGIKDNNENSRNRIYRLQ